MSRRKDWTVQQEHDFLLYYAGVMAKESKVRGGVPWMQKAARNARRRAKKLEVDQAALPAAKREP